MGRPSGRPFALRGGPAAPLARLVRAQPHRPKMGRDEEVTAQQVGADHLIKLARRDDAAEARGDLALVALMGARAVMELERQILTAKHRFHGSRR